jgi:hypothetical protein
MAIEWVHTCISEAGRGIDVWSGTTDTVMRLDALRDAHTALECALALVEEITLRQEARVPSRP